MAEEILIRINLQSGEAKAKIDGVKKSTSRLAQEKKKLIELQKAEAIEIAKLIEQQKIQRELNTKLAQSELGVGQAVNSTTAALKTGRAQSGLNNAILLETSRLASDASFGFTAIANNLSQVINLFVSFARTNGGVIASIKELSRSFLGTGGLLIVVQLLISFGPKLFKFFKDLISGADEANEKIKELTKSFDDQIRIVRILSGQVTGRFLKTFDDLKDTVTILASEFPKFAQALKNLSEQGLENNEKRLRQLVSDFTKISEIQASIAILEDSLIKVSLRLVIKQKNEGHKKMN